MIDPIIQHSTDRIRFDIPREQLIDAQHEALDMLVFLRRNDPDFIAEQARNEARMPRCANHPDRTMATYEADLALCADCYVALVKVRKDHTKGGDAGTDAIGGIS